MSDDPKPRPDVEKLKQYVQEKLREGLKGFAGQPNSDEALKAAEVICREALEDLKNAWLIPTFKVTVEQSKEDKTLLIGTIQGFMPSGKEYEDILEIGPAGTPCLISRPDLCLVLEFEDGEVIELMPGSYAKGIEIPQSLMGALDEEVRKELDQAAEGFALAR